MHARHASSTNSLTTGIIIVVQHVYFRHVGCNRPVNVCNMPVTGMIFCIGYLHYNRMCVYVYREIFHEKVQVF